MAIPRRPAVLRRGDGRPDIVVGETKDKLRLVIYENVDGGKSWKPHLVSEGKESHKGANAVDLDEQCGVTEPGHAQTTVRPLRPKFDRVHDRQLARRHASFAATQELAHRRPLDPFFEPRRDRIRVHKGAAIEPWRGLDALCAKSARTVGRR